LVTGILALGWAVFALLAVYAGLQFVLTSFPWTRGLGLGLAAMVALPVSMLAAGAISVVPELFFLAVLTLAARYALRVIRLFFDGVAAGTVAFRSFDPEWAAPTYRLVRMVVIALTVVVAYPYVPGSHTDAFKGVSLFIGVVFSLGSSSLIGNLIAGYSMTYRRAFRVGDYVKIGQHAGTVESIRLLVTHLRTPKNEEVIIPNSQILGADVVNYSTLSRSGGLILHTTVGIGYETSWRQVEAMLIEAAGRTDGMLKEPAPFALQTALGDFAVTYELNAYSRTPNQMPHHYAALHRNILDVFNEYGVQIMTPAYEGDPDQPKVVPPSAWYDAPAKPPDPRA
jgi:small-conductance mechanosensitive channel